MGVGVAVLGGVGVAAYLQHPLFGELPSGERQARIERSPNYADGAFHNQTDTPLLTTDQTQVSIMLDNMRNKGTTRPPMPLPATKTDLKALDASDDVVVWLGHSSYYVQLGGQRLLIDPVFSVNASPCRARTWLSTAPASTPPPTCPRSTFWSSPTTTTTT